MVSRLCLSLLLALSLPSCVYFGVNAPPKPAPGTQVQGWPQAAFTEVRGYCYDYTAEDDSSFFVNGRMHRGVLDAKGVKLSPPQVIRLLNAITTSHGKQARTPCYKPHHAFVFYDATGRSVAVFEMCFGCNKFQETPDGLPEYVDTPALYTLCQELGLPLGQGNAFYTEVCSRGKTISY
ncbi:MAG: hypothetical protein ACAH88_13720 [Roseimicrobium sp.]